MRGEKYSTEVSPCSEAQTPGAGGLLGLLMPFVIMLVVVYFFMIRPQQAQQKERQAMLDALRRVIES